jgi:hypothetical protein
MMEENTDIEILYLLLQATRNKMMVWKFVEDSENDLFSSEIGTDSFEIELINLQKAGESTCERALARIQGRKIYQTYAIGTKGFDLLLLILRENIFGWKEGSEGAARELIKLRKRLETKITEQKL